LPVSEPVPNSLTSRPPAALAVRQLQVQYGSFTAVRDLSFTLASGEIGCLLGPSGCGKTTVLRAVSGFEAPTEGTVWIGGREVSNRSQVEAPETREIGMVFQDFALFPHLTVAQNVAFGLAGKMPEESLNKRVSEMLSLTGMRHSPAKFPHELSGGQQQRVALARALAPAPKLLLLDEPFSSLDSELREQLSLDVRTIIKSTGTTALLVTHDQHEAFAMADCIGVMQRGALVQWDSAYNLYHRPANRFVADFIGQGAFVPGEVQPNRTIRIELGELSGDLEGERVGAAHDENGKGSQPHHVDVLLRPDDVIHDDASPVQAEVLRKAFRGADFLYALKLPSGQEVLALVPSHHNHAIGERIGVRLELDHVVAFTRTS
jgi:iron(III) transport system ATP-binding protein